MKNRKLVVSIIAAFLAAIMVFGIIAMVIPTPVSAESSASIKKRIEALEEEKEEPPAEEQVAGPLRLLDESLAPLAANPTLAGLDALLPPLPQKPFLCLLCGVFPGEYRALVILPSGQVTA